MVTSGSLRTGEWSLGSFLSRATSRSTSLDKKLPTDWGKGMNDPEVTMLDALPTSNLTAYRKALEAAGAAIELAKRVPTPLKSLAGQVIRSASSVPANLAEGHGRNGRDRAHHCRIAYASAKEVDCHLRLLRVTGAVHRGKATNALQLFDEVRAMIWRLLNPKT
jgi:four helix bundle protein